MEGATFYTIRLAERHDFPFVSELMDQALSPYYGGDHQAHARRIFETHVRGGQDNIGFFSSEQKMFILCDKDTPVGLLHLVGKRQQTYKISPLIIASTHQGKHGLGTLLLKHAERYARDHGARQLYCTVAEENKSALQFFLRKDFIIAGRSHSHYKLGITELMLYKSLLSEDLIREMDVPNISVIPAADEHQDQMRQLLLNRLPATFKDIDSAWVDALFAGYSRRHTGDINEKYKLLFVACDRSGSVLGVLGATPKKGYPIKLMPFIAVSLPGFSAMLADIPYQLKNHGHKLYIHIVPSVEETIALQRQGWRLDAAMPGAYHDSYVTQQWSLDVSEEITMRTMRVKQQYLDHIVSGRKTLEVRVAYDSIKNICPGERIRLMSHSQMQIIRIDDVRKYQSFHDLMQSEDAERIVPGMTQAQVLKLLREIYPPDKERLGVIVLQVSLEKTPPVSHRPNQAMRTDGPVANQ